MFVAPGYSAGKRRREGSYYDSMNGHSRCSMPKTTTTRVRSASPRGNVAAPLMSSALPWEMVEATRTDCWQISILIDSFIVTRHLQIRNRNPLINDYKVQRIALDLHEGVRIVIRFDIVVTQATKTEYYLIEGWTHAETTQCDTRACLCCAVGHDNYTM